MKARSITVAVMLFALVVPVMAQDDDDVATITVDVGTRSVDPVSPRANLSVGQSLLVNVVNSGQPLRRGHVRFSVAGRTLTPANALWITFVRCGDRRPWGIGLQKSSECLTVREITNASSGNAPPTARVEVGINDGAFDIGVEYDPSDSASVNFDSAAPVTFGLSVVHRSNALVFSGGLAFLNIRDEEYRLDPISDNSTEVTLVRAGEGDIPYKVSAFANYMGGLRFTKSLGLAFGVAVDVPVESVSVMAGLTYSLRTLKLGDSAYITAGLAYSQQNELKPEFRGRSTVPSSTAFGDLTRRQYEVGPFVAIGFGFAGGAEEQFKVVVSGSGDSGN
jgi:hypothetical protein